MTKEGLTIFQTPPESPRIPHPSPIKVQDRLDLRYARLKALLQDLRKDFELLDNILFALDKVQDPQLREVLRQNMKRKNNDLDEKWRQISHEITALQNGDFEELLHFKTPLEPEEKKTVGRVVVMMLIPRMDSTRFNDPLLNNKYHLWCEVLRQRAYGHQNVVEAAVIGKEAEEVESDGPPLHSPLPPEPQTSFYIFNPPGVRRRRRYASTSQT